MGGGGAPHTVTRGHKSKNPLSGENLNSCEMGERHEVFFLLFCVIEDQRGSEVSYTGGCNWARHDATWMVEV